MHGKKLTSPRVCALIVLMWIRTAAAEQIPVRHVQLPMQRWMVTRSQTGEMIARDEFSQSVQGDEVTMHFTLHFLDGSVDEETTSYRQEGMFRLLVDRHIERGPFFARPVDFTVDAATGVLTSRSPEARGGSRVESRRMDLPADVANGIVGTLLLNVPRNTKPFSVDMVAPVEGGRLVQLLISPEGERSFKMDGQNLTATVFRVHPVLGGIVGLIARLLGLQPKDVMVWIWEGSDPAVVRIVGQLGGSGPVVTSDLVGASFGRP
ncbi:MAG: hypothetical protein ACP5E5_10630 [Acidobacteriaceae bacterium]